MQEKHDKNKKPKKALNEYTRYSGMAFQMIAIIVIGVVGGLKLDEWMNMKMPVFTAILSIISVAFAIYYFVKDLIK